MFVILKRDELYTFGNESGDIMVEGDVIVDRKEDIREAIEVVAKLNREVAMKKAKKTINLVEDQRNKPSELKFP